jgi:hypothetical protein
MRWNGFTKSLGFAAVAGLGVAPWVWLAAPLLGGRAALTLYAVGASAAYLVGLGDSRRRGLAAAGVAGGLAAAFAWVAPAPEDAVLGAALGLALGRSGVLYRAPFARALVLEATLALAAVGLAGHLFSGSLVSAALASWAFFLVQSAWFLVGGRAPRCETPPGQDPYDAARARALAILGDGGT